VLHDPAQVRDAYERGAEDFLDAVRSVPDEGWGRPALGAWTVRELVAHTLRAFTTVEAYLGAEPSVDRPLADAAEYYRVVLADPSIHSAVLARGRDAGRDLTDPVGMSETVVQRVLGLVAGAADDDVVQTFAGQITLAEYLATRVVEVAVHTLDLQRALGQRPHLHPDTSEVVLQLLTELGPAEPMILALTGRAPLPDGFNALG
jgi:uncharacterized protein (TIGR03083 family)